VLLLALDIRRSSCGSSTYEIQTVLKALSFPSFPFRFTRRFSVLSSGEKKRQIGADETCYSSVRICACMKITGSYGPILVMIVAACFFVAGVGCSLALIIRELRKAPEGYEDEHGFHTVRNGAVKYGVPDSMKARRTRSSLNWAMHRTLRIKAFRVRGLPFFGKRVPHAASEFSATSRRRAGSCR
jgi:hypothetical protein